MSYFFLDRLFKIIIFSTYELGYCFYVKTILSLSLIRVSSPERTKTGRHAHTRKHTLRHAKILFRLEFELD